ncbi:DnaJ domain-containing protein [bacterium]|nr:DnaJ domain-containing protein [bacterium]
MSDEYKQIDAMRLQLEREKKALGILELSAAWNQGQVKRAWRQKVFRIHPDRNQGNENAHRKFILLTCAYRFLIDGQSGAELDMVNSNNEFADLNNDCRIKEREYHDWWKNNYF